jgi:hypothetical protein
MSDRPPRSEAFYLALIIAGIHAALLTVLAIIAWRSPFMLFRLPEKEKAPAATHQPAQEPGRQL